MRTLQQELSDWMADAFVGAFPDHDLSAENLSVHPTANAQFGDYQCDAAMKLARVLKGSPREIAQAAVAMPGRPDCIGSLEVAGPGFINIALSDAWIARTLCRADFREKLGIPLRGEGRTLVMDYSSPNVAKPMHIGHIRSTVIGNALDRLHRKLGYRVVADNHVGDWGTQFGLLILGYRHFVDEAALTAAPVEELERIYRESYARSEQDEDWRNQAREELVKLQRGDKENRALWEKFIALSKEEFNRIYQRLGITFDIERGESYYNERLAGVIEQLRENDLVEESEGALIVRFEKERLPVSIVRKKDGGFNYTTTDLATVMSRVEEFDPDAIIYVTDERQQLHFRQFFAIARRLGITVKLRHVWFGLMRLPDATFSTRQGNVIKLEALLDEAESRALSMALESSPEMDPAHQREVARVVGIGAVKYADLSQNPQSTVTFTWDKALALDGNSAPYLQYAYARIASVLDKYRDQCPESDFTDAPIVLNEPVERQLAVALLRFGEAVESAAENCRPNYLADYLYELAQTYSSFYQNVPFLKAAPGIRESRIRLCDLVAHVLKEGLNLLGIETLERI